ncbi:DUF2642 domain-containing protein [Bacillus sp. JJ1533]|uniref:DUF2642 domain-containing protein n=1 Tax=Bacillus sp. JJ1533 TaxID=3122959 RepID=UPI003000556F
MESYFQELIGKTIEIEISGGNYHKGILIDAGLDIIVIYNGRENTFLYIPFVHVQRLKESLPDENFNMTEPPTVKPIESELISFRKILMTAKGLFVQVYVTGNKSIHGYLTSIMNDFFVFHSPIYKTMYISMNHVKWLIPFPQDTTPYTLTDDKLLLSRPSVPLARSFKDQLKKFENKLVILDGGDNPEKIGLLQEVNSQKVTLITAEGETLFRNLEHIKTIQLP